MKGKYKIVIHDTNVRYELELERNITIIKGKSGTGKTNLYRMIEDVVYSKRGTGVHCNCTDKLRVLRLGDDWESIIRDSHNKIFVADEYIDYVYTNSFARVVNNSDNYFIIITRSSNLTNLGFSVDSIFELGTERNNDYNITKLYKRFTYENEKVRPNLIITEDSNSGFEMIKSIMDCDVISSSGNSSVYRVLMSNYNKYDRIYIIVDGAAFGAFIENIMKRVDNEKVYLFAPESFEFMLLCEKTFRNKLTDELTKTYNYCETTKFAHWEKYYTYLLNKLCKEYFGITYKKKTLDKFFKTDVFKKHIMVMLKDLVVDE